MGHNKMPRALKAIANSNQFIFRYDTVVCLYEINETYQAIELYGYNTGLWGITLDVNQIHKKIAICDSDKYAIVYDYQHSILPLARYMGSHMINDLAFIGSSLIAGDKGGNITMLELNLDDEQDINKTTITRVASLYTGEEVFMLRPNQQESTVFYGC